MGQESEKSLIRCPWVDLSKPDYIEYHDLEWGVPLHDDQMLFEFLVLESAQAGLSWYTVLKKRGNYRKAFNGFDPEKVANYNDKRIEKLLSNAGIIRNRLKIQSTITNAQKFLDIVEEYGSFDAYVWRFVDGTPILNRLKSLDDYPATSKASDAFSQDLKQRGFKFVGPTICYAFMQATGLVNDHSLDCYRRQEILDTY